MVLSSQSFTYATIPLSRRAWATAISAPTRALFMTSAMFDFRERPCVSSLTRFSRKGVMSLPSTFFSAASASATSIALATISPSASCSAGIGTATMAPLRPSRRIGPTTVAASAVVSTRIGAFAPDLRVKNAGNSSAPSTITVVPCVSSTSNVRGMSRMDLTPALTTHTGVRPSSVRSADTSMVCSPPRWTPPTPPVTNTGMPAMCATIIVADTVVAPCKRCPKINGMSRREHLRIFAGPSLPKSSSSSDVSPTWMTPERMATVAGVAPFLRTTSSTPRAHCTFSGYGMPCEMIVDSSATTGSPFLRARATSGCTLMGRPLLR
eukprot:PhM_4_TR1176/c0_g1_i1/m.14206